MITAKEAKRLATDESVLKSKLEVIESEIKNMSALGYTSIDVGCPDKKLARTLIDVLKEHGYTVYYEYEILTIGW